MDHQIIQAPIHLWPGRMACLDAACGPAGRCAPPPRPSVVRAGGRYACTRHTDHGSIRAPVCVVLAGEYSPTDRHGRRAHLTRVACRHDHVRTISSLPADRPGRDLPSWNLAPVSGPYVHAWRAATAAISRVSPVRKQKHMHGMSDTDTRRSFSGTPCRLQYVSGRRRGARSLHLRRGRLVSDRPTSSGLVCSRPASRCNCQNCFLRTTCHCFPSKFNY
jgi:hypothetical protein